MSTKRYKKLSHKAIIRTVQIDLILGRSNPIIDIFNNLWEKLVVVEVNVYHKNGNEYIYYLDDEAKTPIFYNDVTSREFWVTYKSCWSIIQEKFSLKYYDTQIIIGFLLSNALNTNIESPFVEELNSSLVYRAVESIDINTHTIPIKTYTMSYSNIFQNTHANKVT